MNRKLIFIFPGQASQYVGMGLDLYEHSRSARQVMDRISATEGLEHIRDLAFEGPEELLTRTDNVQPAITAVSLMALAAVRERFITRPELIKPVACAGHSLGEYSAHVAAGNISEILGVELVAWRGRWMNEAAQPPNPAGAMVAVMGLSLDSLEEIVHSIGTDRLAVANLNNPGQVILSGEKNTLVEAVERAKASGAKRTVMLNVSGAWHSPLMKPASRKMSRLLKEKIKPGILRINQEIPVVANATAEPVSGQEELLETLAAQVTSPVKWEASIRRLLELVETPDSLFVEIGPGKVLKGLMRSIDRKLQVINVENCSDIDNLFLKIVG